MEDEVAALVCASVPLTLTAQLINSHRDQVIDNGSGMCKAGCKFFGLSLPITDTHTPFQLQVSYSLQSM